MSVRVVVAVASRELKAALFVALSADPEVEIVATASTMAELVTYSRAFRPDVAVVEPELPGGDIEEALTTMSDSTERVFLVGEGAAGVGSDRVVPFGEIDDLVGSIADSAKKRR